MGCRTVFYGRNGEPIITPETTEHVAKLVEEFGSDGAGSEREAKDLQQQKDHHLQTNGTFTKRNDIMT